MKNSLWIHNKINTIEDKRKERENTISEAARSNAVQLVIREFVQNSIDNHVNRKTPVVRIRLGENPKLREYFENLIDHIGAKILGEDGEGNRHTTQDMQWEKMNEDIYSYLKETLGIEESLSLSRSRELLEQLFSSSGEYLLLEDYNCVGLTGPIHNRPISNENKVHKEDYDSKYRYRKYVFEEGYTSSEKGSGGSHGWGRFSMLYSSCIQSILLYSRRDKKTHDVEEVLTGISLTQPRTYNTKEYAPRSYFAKMTNEQFSFKEGYTEHDLIARAKDNFKLRRLAGEEFSEQAKTRAYELEDAGISVVIPFPLPEFSFSLLLYEIVLNYLLIILRGKLMVFLEIQGQKPIVLDEESVISVTRNLLREIRENATQEDYKKLEGMYQLATLIEERKLAEKTSPDFAINVNDFDRLVDYFSSPKNKEKLEKLKGFYFSDQFVFIQCEKSIPGESDFGYFELYLKRTVEESYSYVMRHFNILFKKSKRYGRFLTLVELPYAIPGETDKINPYAEIVRKRETGDHQDYKKKRLGSGGNTIKGIMKLLDLFGEAYKLCSYLEGLDRKVTEMAGPQFKIQSQLMISSVVEGGQKTGGKPSSIGGRASGRIDIFDIEIDELRRKFALTENEEFTKAYPEGVNIQITLQYLQESNNGQISTLKKTFLPKATLKGDDAVKLLEGDRSDTNTFKIRVTAPFKVVIIYDNSFFKHGIRCEVLDS